MRKNIFDDFGSSSSSDEEKQSKSGGKNELGSDGVEKQTLKSTMIPPPRRRRGERFEEEEDFEIVRREETFYTSRDEDIFDETELEESMSLTDRKKVFKKSIELPKIDHSRINYKRMEKVIFSPPSVDRQLVVGNRKKLGIKVSGFNSDVCPIQSFSDVTSSESLLRSMRTNRFISPTPIQAQTIPLALCGRDVISISPTGSGKTLAFVYSSILHFLKQTRVEKKASPIVLILSPTRELTFQISRVLINLTRHLSQLTGVVVLVGGVDKNAQFKDLRRGVCDFIVGTPGRVIDLYKMKAFSLREVTMVILDEVDRMFELGFGKQVEGILGQIRLDRQNLCFSATVHPRVLKLVQDVMVDPVEVRTFMMKRGEEEEEENEVGKEHPLLHSLNPRIHQRVVVVDSDEEKFRLFHEVHLPFFLTLGSILVFVRSRVRTEEISTRLCEIGFIASSLHGEKNVEEREEVLFAFRNGTVRILVATDIASRGLDIPNIQTVVNYDVPKNLETYVHRIGRTGRSLTNERERNRNQVMISINPVNNISNNENGKKKRKKKKKSGFSRKLYDGNSVTFVERKKDAYFAPRLVQVIESVGQEVNPELIKIALRNPKFRKTRKKSSGREVDSSLVHPPPPPSSTTTSTSDGNLSVSDGGTRRGIFDDRNLRYYSATNSAPLIREESEIVKHIRKQFQHSFVYSNTQYFDDTEEIEIIPPKEEEVV